MKIFYARVSTEDQNEARQIEKAKELGAERIFLDKMSGKNTDRPALQEMLAFVREGDVIITESFSRIARNTRDLLDIVETLRNKGVDLISDKEKLDTNTPQGRFMLQVFGAMAELERETILQRQREGIAIAKAEGKYHGRKRIGTDETLTEACKAWRAGEITAREAMARAGLKPNTFYRRVKEKGL